MRAWLLGMDAWSARALPDEGASRGVGRASRRAARCAVSKSPQSNHLASRQPILRSTHHCPLVFVPPDLICCRQTEVIRPDLRYCQARRLRRTCCMRGGFLSMRHRSASRCLGLQGKRHVQSHLQPASSARTSCGSATMRSCELRSHRPPLAHQRSRRRSVSRSRARQLLTPPLPRTPVLALELQAELGALSHIDGGSSRVSGGGCPTTPRRQRTGRRATARRFRALPSRALSAEPRSG